MDSPAMPMPQMSVAQPKVEPSQAAPPPAPAPAPAPEPILEPPVTPVGKRFLGIAAERVKGQFDM